jgi:hypothetical protein
MSLKDLLKKVNLYLLILAIALLALGVGVCFTGIGALCGVPMVIIGIFLIKSRTYLENIINEKDSITKNLFLYFSELKKSLILSFVSLVGVICSIIIGYIYLQGLFQNLIF